MATDWQVDPVLKQTCANVVTSSCSNIQGGSNIMNCLMNQLVTQSRHMTKNCAETLMEIQYFMARDFSLDPKLYMACRTEAQNLCNADENWISHKMHGQYIFACLSRNMYGDEETENEDTISMVSDACADEIERVLEQRAISVNLHPEIEDACRYELTQNCASAIEPGAEFQCLQDIYDQLGKECHNAIQEYTEMEAKNAILNPVIASACHVTIDKECQEEVERKDEGLVIQCLIKVREDQGSDGMDEKCSAAIEHWQIISLKDYRFSFKFKEACRKDIASHCSTDPQTNEVLRSKADIVGCLSEIARNDVLTEKDPKTLSVPCLNQLQFQLLQKHSSIKLNPKVARSCSRAIKLYCPVGKGNVLECLKSLDHTKMSSNCRMNVSFD